MAVPAGIVERAEIIKWAAVGIDNAAEQAVADRQVLGAILDAAVGQWRLVQDGGAWPVVSTGMTCAPGARP